MAGTEEGKYTNREFLKPYTSDGGESNQQAQAEQQSIPSRGSLERVPSEKSMEREMTPTEPSIHTHLS